MRQAVHFFRMLQFLAPNPIFLLIPSLDKYSSGFVKAIR